MTGVFIVVEGMDGSGKTELVGKLHNYLFSKDKRFRILTTREPSNGVHGEEIRARLRGEKDPGGNGKEMLALFVKDRRDHLESTVLPFLDDESGNCHIVLCDRYYYSTLAFQQAQGIPFGEIWERNKDFRKPDLALFLDLSPEEALRRIGKREKEKFERRGFMERLRKNFLALKEKLPGENIVVLDASKDRDAVLKAAKKEVDMLLKKAGCL